MKNEVFKKVFKKCLNAVKDYIWEEDIEEVELNDFDRIKIEKITKKAREYYLTMAINTPELLADMLAKQTIGKDIENPDKVNELYELAYGKTTMNELRLM